MRTKQEKRTCDHCGKYTTIDLESDSIGGHPFNGWFELQKHGGGTTLKDLREKGAWDFCSKVCLVKALSRPS